MKRTKTRTLILTPVWFAALFSLRLQCAMSYPFTSAGDIAAAPEVPATERLLRAADTLLMEPAYARARELAANWSRYTQRLTTDEKQIAQLETLANTPAITGFLHEPEGSLAAAFRSEVQRSLQNFGNGAITAWRLRSLAGVTVLAHNEARLSGLDTSETRREIGPRYFIIPISSVGFNFTLDAEWDVTRLSNYPLTQANSEFLFVQTDAEMRLTGKSEGRVLPDSAYRFISADKFVAEKHGVQHGMRIIFASAGDARLLICYPFAGYAFYAVRGTVALLLLVAAVLALKGLGALRRTTQQVLENREGAWLGEHYQTSLSLNEKALGITDRSVTLVAEIKDRDASLIEELGKKLGEISAGIEEQTRFIVEEAVKSQITTAQPAAPAQEVQTQRPLYRKHVYRPPVLIEATDKPEVQVSLEMDLPLKDEKELPPEEKASYISSLRRRASEKSGPKEYVHDEKIDNFDYVPPEPMAMPERPTPVLAATPDAGDLEYVQKFRYTGKPRVMPMTARRPSTAHLKMHEDLHREALVVHSEEE